MTNRIGSGDKAALLKAFAAADLVPPTLRRQFVLVGGASLGRTRRTSDVDIVVTAETLNAFDETAAHDPCFSKDVVHAWSYTSTTPGIDSVCVGVEILGMGGGIASVIRAARPTLMKPCLVEYEKIGDLDGTELEFKNENRPAHRFRYYHFVSTLLRYVRYEKPGWAEKRVNLPTGKIWATPGPYLRKSMLKALANVIGDCEPSEGVFDGVFDGKGGKLPQEKKLIAQEILVDRERRIVSVSGGIRTLRNALAADPKFSVDRRTRHTYFNCTTGERGPIDVIAPAWSFRSRFDAGTLALERSYGVRVLNPVALLESKCQSILGTPSETKKRSDSKTSRSCWTISTGTVFGHPLLRRYCAPQLQKNLISPLSVLWAFHRLEPTSNITVIERAMFRPQSLAESWVADSWNIFEEAADVNEKVQGSITCWCIEPGMGERVEELVERREAIEPDCVTRKYVSPNPGQKARR
ncbi:MAG: hypothetical protein M1840_008698 [Geoglossum simile]|nr:MAG: hypothetical protein M1840_008698 [Geoglossum simile]